MRVSLLAAFLLTLAMCKKPAAPAEDHAHVKYIAAQSGLRMRGAPATTGKKLRTIPHKARVEWLEDTGAEIKIGGATGKWAKIRYRKKEGFVFGAWLSDSPIIELRGLAFSRTGRAYRCDYAFDRKTHDVDDLQLYDYRLLLSDGQIFQILEQTTLFAQLLEGKYTDTARGIRLGKTYTILLHKDNDGSTSRRPELQTGDVVNYLKADEKGDLLFVHKAAMKAYKANPTVLKRPTKKLKVEPSKMEYCKRINK